MTWLDTSNVVPAVASSWKESHRSRLSTGSSPTVGSSSTRQVGFVQKRGRERDAARSARQRASPRADSRCPRARRARARRRCGHARPRRSAPKYVRFSRTVRSRVDGRSLGDVADPSSQRHSTSRPAQDRDLAVLDDLYADDGPDQCRLAASARAQQSRDRSGLDVEVEPRKHDVASTDHAQTADGDCRTHRGSQTEG